MTFSISAFRLAINNDLLHLGLQAGDKHALLLHPLVDDPNARVHDGCLLSSMIRFPESDRFSG
jgi:hypothetical protein